MSVDAGTVTRYDIVGEREDLADAIYDISPMQTPFLSGIGRGSASAVLHEWQTDSLADAVDDNAQLEGDDAAFELPAPTVRVGNYCQIMRKTAQVSDTADTVSKAGRSTEMAYQMAKRAKELKRDHEKTLLANQGADGGDRDNPRTFAALLAWIKTNVNKATDGTNPTYTSGVPTGATGRGDGTQRAFDEDQLKAVVQAAWENGGEPSVLMLGAFNKTVFSTFEGVASKTVQVPNSGNKAVTVGAVDIYVSDFGDIRAVPNRFQRARDAFLLDFELISVRYLRPYKQKPLAETGDSTKRMILHESTLRVNQEAGLGLIADLTTA